MCFLCVSCVFPVLSRRDVRALIMMHNDVVCVNDDDAQ